ncbi:MAG: CoA-binding protein [Deltaproteobacteria bacterium]|nr:CoA-binding protein [Candidatus Zymogenaceae bacterium]
MDAHSRKELDRILHPRSVAVVGASASPGKFGWIFLKSLIHIGFSGNLYPINKNVDEILGYKAYPSLAALPEVPDMVVVTIPARHVPDALEEALAAGVPGAVVITAGFGEDSDEGKLLEARVKEIAGRGIRVIGPNCFGVYSPRAGITVIPGSGFSRESGPVGFFAQSGGLTADLGQIAIGRGVKFSAMVSYGNAADVGELDMLDYFAHDPNTSIIAAYLEGVSDGPRFLRLLTEVAAKKPVIIWKGGASATGARMVMSHTGSMGGQAAIWDAVFNQTGAVKVRGLTELIDTLAAFSSLYPRAGRRIAMMGGGGALGVEASDIVDELGLVMPVFDGEIQAEINKHLPEFGKSAKNPVDTGTPLIGADPLAEIMRIIAGRDNVDVIFVVQLLFHSQVLMRRVAGQAQAPLALFAHYPKLAEMAGEISIGSGKPVIAVLPQTSITQSDEDLELEREIRRAADAFQSAGCVVFPTIDRALKALARVAGYQEYRELHGRAAAD